MISIDEEYCRICGNGCAELHHIVYRSQSVSIKNCKLNHIYLCPEHHRGKFGVHSKNGYKLNIQIKLEMQQNIELLLDKQYFTWQEIQNIFMISEKATDTLCKTIKQYRGTFAREDILRATMGRLITEEEVKELNE